VGVSARQSLVKVVVGVDEPGQHDMARSIVDGVDRRDGLPAGRHQLDDAGAVDHDAAFGTVGENGERILEPEAHGQSSDMERSAIRACAEVKAKKNKTVKCFVSGGEARKFS